MSGRATVAQAERARLSAAFPRSSHMPLRVDPFVSRDWVDVPPHVDLAAVAIGKSGFSVGAGKNSEILKLVKTDDTWQVLFGRLCSPTQFLARAALVGHPSPKPAPVPDSLRQVVTGTDLSAAHRHPVHFLHSLFQPAKDLSHLEAGDHLQMQSSVKRHSSGQALAALSGTSGGN